MNHNFLFLSILLLALIGFDYSSGQTLTTNLKDLSEKSEVILTGKVTNQKAIWNEDHTKIYTKVTVEVYESLKGNSTSKSIIVKHPGGEVGEVGELYSHMPTFTNNEEVLLFLQKSKTQNEFTVFDGENGKMTLVTDKETNEKMTPDMRSINSLKNQIKQYLENK